MVQWKIVAEKLQCASDQAFTGSISFIHEDPKLLMARLNILQDRNKVMKKSTSLLINRNVVHNTVVRQYGLVFELYRNYMEDLLESLKSKREKIYTHALTDFEGDKGGVARISAHRNKLLAENHLLLEEKEYIRLALELLSLELERFKSNIVEAERAVTTETNKKRKFSNDVANDLFLTFVDTIRESLKQLEVEEVVYTELQQSLTNVSKEAIPGLKYYSVIEKELGSGYDFIRSKYSIRQPTSCECNTGTFLRPTHTDHKDHIALNNKYEWVCYPREEIALSKLERNAAYESFGDILEKLIIDAVSCEASHQERVWSCIEPELLQTIAQNMLEDKKKIANSFRKLAPECNRAGPPLTLADTFAIYMKAQNEKAKT
ncbi:hypothetical protein EAF04_005796 [Stromatinia cepivora]|nr:hypothetical protein EAF04_005796 [Stromatinia cepivora]